MKKFVAGILSVIFICSCESDSDTTVDFPQENLLANTTLVSKLSRVVQQPTTFDNIADNSSCFSLQLPVTLFVNGQTVNITSAVDYAQVATLFNASTTDTDSVALQYPVTLLFADYTQQQVDDATGLSAAIAGCTGSVELSCLSLLFPLQVATYNTQDQVANTITIGNSRALFEFLASVSGYDAVSLRYPLTLVAPDGSELSIAGSQQLEAAIDSFTATCLAGFLPVPNQTPTLTSVLTSGTWHIAYYFDDFDDTASYSAYAFAFDAGGNLTVTAPAVSTGTWDLYMDSGDQKLEFTFANAALNELEEDWTVISHTATTVTMEHQSGGGGDTEYLTLEKN